MAELGVTRALAAKEEAEIRRALAETAVVQAEAAVTQAEAFVASAREAIDHRTLTAPFKGTVATLMPDLGEIVTPGICLHS